VVSSNKDFRKAWLLHGLEEPTISGNRSVFKDTRPGYSGKLTVDTVFPLVSNTSITKVGGGLEDNIVDGINYLCKVNSSGCNEGGGWRIEVSPKTASETDYFLNVLQVGDHSPDVAPYDVQGIDTLSHAGAKVGDRVVMFSKSRDRASDPLTFSFTGSGTFQIMVADLSEGTWYLERDGVIVGSSVVSADSGVATFSSVAGGMRVLRRTPAQILSQPYSVETKLGSAATLRVSALGAPNLGYQWKKNGIALPGANQATFEVPNVGSSHLGDYSVLVSTLDSSVESTSVSLSAKAQLPGRLAALSVRAESGVSDELLFFGVIAGDSPSTEGLRSMVRGLGPQLSASLSNYVRDPELKLYKLDGTVIAQNDDWSPDSTEGMLERLYLSLNAGSKDAALAAPLPNGIFTLSVGPKLASDKGVVLADLYPIDSLLPGNLKALSVRARAGSGDQTLFAGLMISGEGKCKVLLRGLGPVLQASLPDSYLRDPKIQLRSLNGTLLGENDNWSSSTELTQATAVAGLSALPANSKDAALVFSLDAGLYTISLTGADGGSGVGMIEVYEVR
jgi:hypothetical protein